MLRDQLASDNSWRRNTHFAENRTSVKSSLTSAWGSGTDAGEEFGLWSFLPHETTPPQPHGMEEACLPNGRNLGKQYLLTTQEP